MINHGLQPRKITGWLEQCWNCPKKMCGLGQFDDSERLLASGAPMTIGQQIFVVQGSLRGHRGTLLAIEDNKVYLQLELQGAPNKGPVFARIPLGFVAHSLV